MTSDPTYRDLLYFKLLYTTVFAAKLLRLFYFPNFLHLDWHDLPYTVSTTPQQLGTDYTGCVTSLVMIGKSICPSCQKQRERLEYYCTSEICRGITLVSASTVDSIYNGFYIVFYRVARVSSFARGWTRQSERAPENICAVCRCSLRENKTSKQGKNIWTWSVCVWNCVFVSDFCTPV